jgi:hypothetical protein
MCKRRRSSEVVLAFLQKFHRATALRCQCCLRALFPLLKACESFKEKVLFCYRISAALKIKSCDIRRGLLVLQVSSTVAGCGKASCGTAGTMDSHSFGFELFPCRRIVISTGACLRLTAYAAGSMLNRVDASLARYLKKWLSSLTTRVPFVAAAVAAAYYGCVSRSSRKLLILPTITHPPAAGLIAAGSLVLKNEPGNSAWKVNRQPSLDEVKYDDNSGSTDSTHS